ncbi:MAG: protein of unassigned function [Methylobacterium brachiatum]|nr:protein of unassigned function [Methylobacterium brachiatum]
MPKGYIIVRMTVTDPETYTAYAEMAPAAMRLYGAKPLVRGGRYEALEGEARPRNVVLEFESYDAARAYYVSPEYQAAKAKRLPAGIGEVVLVEGAD